MPRPEVFFEITRGNFVHYLAFSDVFQVVSNIVHHFASIFSEIFGVHDDSKVFGFVCGILNKS